ncbi:hypothetical protein AN963_12055 [Brevibacillus choshinensis]|uniref:Uncharacterized protein n=1 Tax=Brevibacillus choshinensis TaxID=54911 RepID=A0ABR5N552_BRECH|nr:hypothetical protein AN963_12055 [Brevibacillus choshinensis]
MALLLFERRLIVVADGYYQPVARAKRDPKGSGVVPVVPVIPVTTFGTDVFLFHENPPFVYLLPAYAGGQAMLGYMESDK